MQTRAGRFPIHHRRHWTTTRPILLSVAVLCSVWIGRAAEKPVPLAAQLHVVSVHVPDHATFDLVFRFFRESLELPLVYGNPSQPGNPAERVYAGFSVGNAYLEPCGPYDSDAPFVAGKPARFHGLTFAPAINLATVALELSRRNIVRSEILGSGDLPRFIYLSDALLTGKYQAVSFWEILQADHHANVSFLSASLREAKGGALGVKRLAEVRVGYPSNEHLEQWRKLLGPIPAKSEAWPVGSGPAFRFVPAQETQIKGIVLQVESLAEAQRALGKKGLTANLVSQGVELDPGQCHGLQIVLTE